jgi:long-chain acyl-CoA synthetase
VEAPQCSAGSASGAHRAVADVAVSGVPGAERGETRMAFVVVRDGPGVDADALRQWVNAQVGKTRRVRAVQLLAEVPLSAIGKLRKRRLREAWGG